MAGGSHAWLGRQQPYCPLPKLLSPALTSSHGAQRTQDEQNRPVATQPELPVEADGSGAGREARGGSACARMLRALPRPPPPAPAAEPASLLPVWALLREVTLPSSLLQASARGPGVQFSRMLPSRSPTTLTISRDLGLFFFHPFPVSSRAALVSQLAKNPPAMWVTWVRSLGWEDALETGKAPHSSILAWRIPRTVESMRSQGVGHD